MYWSSYVIHCKSKNCEIDSSPTQTVMPFKTSSQSQTTAQQQPPPAQPMVAVSVEAKNEQHIQTDEEGPAARLRGGCIPCPVSMAARSSGAKLIFWGFRVEDGVLSSHVHARKFTINSNCK
jgi:hypothetical protein